MALRQYVCNTWKKLQIGKYVKFKGGAFETEDQKLQELIEKNNAFGSAIHYKDSLDEMNRLGREREEQATVARAKERKRVLREIADEEKAESDKRAAIKAEEKETEEERQRLEESQRRADVAAEEERKHRTEGAGKSKRGER